MNKCQEAVANLLKVSSFNEFDGKQVAKDLETNQDKWLGFIWGRFGYFELIPLRDIDSNYYNTDTLYIKVKKENLEWLKTISETWAVDEFGYYLNGEVEGVYDENLKGIKEGLSLGASPEKDIAYCRLWWD